MDPIEQKPTHLYPNADRHEGVPDTMPVSNNPTTNDSGATLIEQSTSQPAGQNFEAVTPVVHLSDVVTPKEDDKSYRTSTIHTFKDDMAAEASKGNFSIGKIMVASNKKMHSGGDNTVNIEGRDRHVGAKIVVAVVCLIVIGVFSYVGFKSAKTPQEVAVLNNPNQQTAGGILYTEQSQQIDLTGKNRSTLYNEISRDVSSVSIPVGKMKSVVFTYKNGTSTVPILASDFLNIIAPSAPDLLLRNIKDQYVFGYYSFDSNEPFIILKSSNYDSVFAGMLDWENTMYADLGDLIYKKESLSAPSAATSQISTSTASSSTTNKSTAKKATSTSVALTEFDTPFVDRVISNLDARVLYRPNGNIAFFYAFFNKDTVIIAVSESSLREIIYRLTSGKITR